MCWGHDPGAGPAGWVGLQVHNLAPVFGDARDRAPRLRGALFLFRVRSRIGPNGRSTIAMCSEARAEQSVTEAKSGIARMDHPGARVLCSQCMAETFLAGIHKE